MPLSSARSDIARRRTRQAAVEIAGEFRDQPRREIAHQPRPSDLRQHSRERVADGKIDARPLLDRHQPNSGFRPGSKTGCAGRCRCRRCGRTYRPGCVRRARRRENVAAIGPILTRIAPSTRSGFGGAVNDAPGRQAATAAISPNIAKTCSGGCATLKCCVSTVAGMKSGIEATALAAAGVVCSLAAGAHALSAAIQASARADRTQNLPPSTRFRRDIACAPRFDHGLDRPHDADIAGAAAQIAAQSDADQAFIGLRQAQHEIARGDQHSRRAVTALQRMFAGEGRTKF